MSNNANDFKPPVRQQPVREFGFVSPDGKIPERKFNLVERLIAVQFFKEGSSRGGVIMPDMANNLYTPRGKIIQVGPKCEMGLKVGDVVLFYQKSMVEKVFHDGDEMWVLDERSILGVEIPEIQEK